MSVKYYERSVTTATSQLDLSKLGGKSVIVTGGAMGLGKAYAEAFAAAGAYVTIGDLNEKLGAEVAAEISNKGQGAVQFLKCDVRIWEDQVALFKAATDNSPNQSCDIVIANAGIAGPDGLLLIEDPSLPPVKPDLSIVDVNIGGVVYTTKLAIYHFSRQVLSHNRDRCLILKASLAGYLDLPGSPMYNISKFGVRSLMRNLRWTSWHDSIRVNVVAPWVINTPILPEGAAAYLESQGAEFALAEDAAKTMLKIASDREVNGRSFGVVPRSWEADGYVDLDFDDYKEGQPLDRWQKKILGDWYRDMSLMGRNPPASQFSGKI